MQRIQKNDEVILLAGKDKGAIGTVVKIVGEKVIVEGVNVAKKHTKPNPQAGVEGGIISKEMPVAVSNVAVYNPETKKADKIGFRTTDGKKERFFKSNGNAVVVK
jgi:large subunit ribosomal protein L24